MGVSRINQLPERALIATLTEAREASRELKGSAQRVSGANLAYFVSSSPSTYDWVGRLDNALSLSGRGQARFVITLNSSTAVVPMTDVAVTVFYSTDGVNYAEYGYARGIAESYNAIAPEITRRLEALHGAEVPPGTAKFSFLLYGQYNAHVAFKVEAVGTDEVTIDVVRVS